MAEPAASFAQRLRDRFPAATVTVVESRGETTLEVAASDLLTVLPRHFVHIAGATDELVQRELPFEVPADALEGARLLIPAEGNTRTNDDVADIDLGIDAATAARFADTDAHVALLTSTVVAG